MSARRAAALALSALLLLGGCKGEANDPKAPAGEVGSVVDTTQAPPPAPAPAAPYRSCEQARDAGATPLRRGDPGYSTRLDTDRDGTACE